MIQDHDTTRILDRSYGELREAAGPSDRVRAVGRLFERLQHLRARGREETWRGLLRELEHHPLRDLVHEDPMTRRSYEKPRGYAGDAVLLDYIYRERPLDGVSPVGCAVNEYAVGRAAACAVRHRRDLIAFRIDRMADRRDPAPVRVLSVACGHLREAELSSAVRSGALGELVALDADGESLAEVRRRGLPGVVTVECSIGRLLAGGARFGQFDLVYSAGLYDYLEQPLAARLTARLFEMLRPGGELLLSNFLPTVRDAGFMESFMGWELLLRTLEEIDRFGADVAPGEVARRRVFPDPFGAIGYFELHRV